MKVDTLVIEVTSDVLNILLVNAYGPNTDSPDFFNQLFTDIEKTDMVQVLIVGDLNVAMNEKLDRLDEIQYHLASVRRLTECMHSLNVVDIWRTFNLGVKQYTWSRLNPKLTASRLDYVLGKESLLKYVTECLHVQGHKSDHRMVKTKFTFEKTERGPGCWRFNNQLLKEPVFIQEATSIVMTNQRESLNLPPDIQWEILKQNLISYAKNYAKKSAGEHRELEKDLKEKIDSTQKHIDQMTEPNKVMEYLELDRLKVQLDDVVTERVRGTVFRSRAQWYREGERSSKYFFALEKRNYENKIMNKLITDNGTIISDPEFILEEQYRFYNELYASDESKVFSLQNESGMTIMPCDQLMLDSEITFNECTDALFSMKKDKTPGLDGLSVEFYQALWEHIGELYHKCLIHSIERGLFHYSARCGLITLIPKKKDPRLLKNWRPLTMLTLDYKILAKVLATRVKQILPYLISQDQTGFMEGRQISTTIRTTMDIIEHYQKGGNDKTGYLISLDYKKCFDMIEYSAIYGSLKYFGVGPKFINYVKLLLTDFWSVTSNNGYISRSFKVTRSCHQGCPLSPYLFLLCGETMAHQIRQCSTLKGITIFNLKKSSRNSQMTPSCLHRTYRLLKGSLKYLIR